jgi:hypothetical protein
VNDELFWWEKWPVGALFAAHGLYVWEWYVGARMPAEVRDAMGWLAVAGGVAAWLAIDGAMIATVAGIRQGRRSVWSVAAIVVTAVFGAAVALNGHGELQEMGAWLHAGFAATITCYLLHLAQPRAADAPALPRKPRRRWRAWLRLPQMGLAPAPVHIADAGDARQVSMDADQVCPRCSTPIADRAKWLAARRWNRCDACRGQTEAVVAG